MTDIEYDPVSPSTIYATLFDYGVFRFTDNGHTWQNIYVGEPDDGSTGAFFGIRYEVAAAKLRERQDAPVRLRGRQRGRQRRRRRVRRGVVRPPDRRRAGRAPTFTKLSSSIDGTPGFSSFDICARSARTTCRSPRLRASRTRSGSAADAVRRAAPVRRGRSLERPQHHALDNGGVSFTDMTGDTRDPYEAHHPDVQILAFGPNSSPTIAFFGSDGGVMRTNGKFVNDSADCDEPARNLSGVDLKDCRDWLSVIPSGSHDELGLRTLQFQDLTPNPNNPLRDAIGGTQDNGTLGYSGSGTWLNFVAVTVGSPASTRGTGTSATTRTSTNRVT